MKLQKIPPSEPGWYWCYNDGDAPGEKWLAVVRVDKTEAGLVVSWMTAPGEAGTMHESRWSSDAEWAGPLPAPDGVDE